MHHTMRYEKCSDQKTNRTAITSNLLKVYSEKMTITHKQRLHCYSAYFISNFIVSHGDIY